MNKTYRIIWSTARQAYVVADERARTRGKSSTLRTAIAAALLVPAASASAVTLCASSGANDITTAYSSTCEVQSGASVTISTAGSIQTVDEAAVLLEGGLQAVSIVNEGHLSANNTQPGTIGAIQINNGSLSNGIWNKESGTISGTSSTISGSGSTVAILISNGSTIAGGIVNDGEIRSYLNSGISISDSSIVDGGITNNGTINSLLTAILIDSGSVVNDGINNTGSIHSSQAGINVSNATVTGGIVNSSTVSATSGPAISISNSSVTGGITNSGLLSGTNIGLDLDSSNVVGNVTNSGTIEAQYGNAIRIDDTSITGDIINSGTIEGERGILVESSTINGAIVNEVGGVISGTDGEAIIVTSGSSVGAINNRGVISGTNDAIYITSGSTVNNLTNEGLIEGLNDTLGISIDTGDVTKGIDDTLWNKQGGTITGRSGVGIFSGTIETLRNDGEIYGVAVDPSPSANNSYGVFLDGTNIHVGSIENTGLIQGDLVGLGVNGGVVDAVENSGTIAGSLAGFGMIGQGSVSSLSNSGTISGQWFSIAAMPGAQLSQIDVTGTQALLSGDVFAAGSDFAVKTGATFANSNAILVKSFTVEQGATMQLGAGLSQANGFEFNSFIVNINNGITAINGFVNNGTVAVASGTTATIHGSYTQAASGTFQVGVGNDTTYGKLIVDGQASLPSNAKIAVNVTSPNFEFTVDKMQGVLTATTLQSDGTFVVTDNSYLFDFGAVKNGNSIDLTLQAAQEPEQPKPTARDSVIGSGNTPAIGAATALDRIIANNAHSLVAQHFVGLSNQQQVSNAITQLLPLLTGASTNAASNALSSINRVIQARMDSNAGLSSGEGFLTDNHLWMKPFGSWADQDNRGGVAGYDANTMGFAIGSDAALNEKVRVGVAFAYAKADVDGASKLAPQSMDVDVFQLIGYGSYSLGANTELNFQLDVGQNENSGKRGIGFANVTAKSDYSSFNTHLGAGIGHTLALRDGITFTPSARLDYTTIRDEGYREKGAGAIGLDVSSNRTEELIASVDGKLNLKVTDNTSVALNVGVGYDVTDDRASITAAFAGEPGFGFTTYGIEQNRWLLRSGAGLTHTADNGTEITARYDNESRSGFNNQTASLKVRWAF